MKQDQKSSAKTNSQPNNAQCPVSSAIGIDLGDRWSRYCVVNSAGEVVTEDRVRTTPEGMERLFQASVEQAGNVSRARAWLIRLWIWQILAFFKRLLRFGRH